MSNADFITLDDAPLSILGPGVQALKRADPTRHP